MPDATIGHHDECAIFRTQDHPDVLLRGTVGATQQEIGSCDGQDRPAKTLADKAAAGNRKDAAIPGGRGADFLDWVKVDGDREEVLRLQLCHEGTGHESSLAEAKLIRLID
jgi:hypothetical protein